MLYIIVRCCEKFLMLLVAADDSVEQCPGAVTEPICQLDPTTMQQHIEKAVVTSGRGKGKMSSKRMFQSPMLSFCKYNIQAYNPVFFFLFSQLYEIKYQFSSCHNHQFTESLMVSFLVKMQWWMLVLISSNFINFVLHVGEVCFTLLCFKAIVSGHNHYCELVKCPLSSEWMVKNIKNVW